MKPLPLLRVAQSAYHNEHPAWLISAGEVSGDLFAAQLMQALKALRPELQFVGIGGEHMLEQGLFPLEEVVPRSAVGLIENLPGLPFYWHLFRRICVYLKTERPAAVVLIDFQGLNLRIAKVAKGLGIPVFYYIAPQEWLWGFKGGAVRVARVTTRIFAVFRPEADMYQQRGAPVSYVGHPLLDMLPQIQQAEAREHLGIAEDATVICLMPGSRLLEIQRLFPVLQAVARYLLPHLNNVWFVLPVASSYLEAQMHSQLDRDLIQLVPTEQRYQAMVAADLIIGASGNMVLEAALLNKPVIAMYRVAWLTWLAAKLLLRLPWITLPNILLRQGVVPEFVQFFEPGDVGYKALQLLKDERARNAMLQEFQALRVLLEPHGAARRAATEMVAGVYETTSGPADRVNGS